MEPDIQTISLFWNNTQLEKKFRQHLGRSPQTEIRRVQVLNIRQQLTETDRPLKHIAELTGFDYMEYMSVVFKRWTGLTPGAYRRQHRRPSLSIDAPPTRTPPRFRTQ